MRRTDRFPHCPDLVFSSTYWAETDEVAAFEELVGSHGGLGGAQGFPFVLFPADLPWPAEPAVGAERVHRVLRSWLAELGHEAYCDAGAYAARAPRRRVLGKHDVQFSLTAVWGRCWRYPPVAPPLVTTPLLLGPGDRPA